ncbi:hypothetical protein AB0284_17775 [Pseudarthrobacter phenanthrenivorans]|uniref:hypothetical protein n=1 Tax=Pseudarthrobacter phenanthrenivorans TaxID=361575 RepID=UPI00344EACEF
MIKNDDTSEATSDVTKPKLGLDLSPTQVIAGGGAAAVASIVGGQLGLGGTVIGAFILSVITAVAVPLFRTSLEKSHEHLKRVVPRRGNYATRTTPEQTPATASTIRATSSKVSAVPVPLDREATTQPTTPRRTLPSRARMALGAVAIFVIGLGSVVGVQAATGTALSKGTETLQTGISQVASTAGNSNGTPAKDSDQGARPAVPSTSPTVGATKPTEESTPSPTATSKASPNQTTPASKATQPSMAPTQSSPTAGPGGAPHEADSQMDPGLTVATPAPAAK